MVRVQAVGIDVTVSWMLSRVFPTIRRARRFVFYYTTGCSREYCKTTSCCRHHKKKIRPACISYINGNVDTALLVYDRK